MLLLRLHLLLPLLYFTHKLLLLLLLKLHLHSSLHLLSATLRNCENSSTFTCDCSSINACLLLLFNQICCKLSFTNCTMCYTWRMDWRKSKLRVEGDK